MKKMSSKNCIFANCIMHLQHKNDVDWKETGSKSLCVFDNAASV